MHQKSGINRIEIGGVGIGEAGEDLITRRARELAHADGRQAATDYDRQAARQELLASEGEDPDMVEAERPGSGVPPSSTGHRAPRLEDDDESTFADELVHEGVDEADRDSRVHSDDDL